MINLSTTAAAHAYACRPGGSNVVVVNSISPLGGGRRQQRRRVPSAAHPANGPDTVVNGGLELLGEGFVGINGFRNNRFQYQIPTVGQHYGNAFHLADDDEEVTEVIGDHHHHPGHVEQDGSANGDTMYLHDIMGDHINDDDDEEDVEMSTAVEVISIDPNCDYDTEDEDEGEGDEEDEQDDDDEEEEGEEESCWFVKGGGINMLAPSGGTGSDQVQHNVSLTVDVAHEVIDVGDIRCGIVAMSSPGTAQQGRSRSNSCSSTSSSATNSSSSSSASCNSNKSSKSNISSCRVKQEVREEEEVQELVKKEEENDDEEFGSYYYQNHHQNHSDGTSLEFNPTKGVPFEPPEQLLQVKLESTPPRPQPGRRKRTSSSQRRSFSMPHSPVGAANGIDGVVGSLIPTSFSFEDLDSLVLSPLKALVGGASTGGPVKENDTDLDDSLVEELANDGNFDLAEYITGDDSTTSCDANGYFSERKRPKADNQQGQQQQQQAKRNLAHPKSKGKELKVLRQLMLPQRKPTSKCTLVNGDASLSFSSDELSAQPALNGRRSCTAKVLSRMTLDEDSSDSEADHLADELTTRRKEPTVGIRKGKRKAADDADPTWNPNTNKSLTHVKGDAKVQQHQKLPLANSPCVAVAGKPSPAGNREDAGSGKSSPGKVVTSVTATSAKGVKFGQVVVRKDPSSGASSSPSSTTPVCKKPPLPGNVHKQTNPTGDGGNNPARSDQPRTNVLRKKTNVKLDHDYCSPKSGALAAAAGGQMAASGGVGVGCQRKAIEIPFLLPTKDQLRRERKLQKEKKRTERTVAKKVAQEQQQRVAGEAVDDNSKDKQAPQHQPAPGGGSSNSSSSSLSTVQKTAVKISAPTAHESSLSDVDKPCEKNNPTGNLADCNSDNAGANEVTQSYAKKPSSSFSIAPPVVGGVTVKRQVSLLKINQQTTARASSPRDPSNDDGNANHVSSSGTAGSTSSPPVETQDIAATETGVVRKKLNLQEYKKRREHCEAKPPADPVVVNGGNSAVGGKGDVVPKVQSDPRLRPAGSVSAVARNELPKVASDRIVSVSNGLRTPPTGGTTFSQAGATTSIKQEPLDPISAAKMKALRMQQLKKEAAIKSHEAKLNQKTMPLMPIVPLAQITSLEFDENGNPLSLDEARARKEAADRESLKLHPDFEEIVIVSVGCNTAVTIVPGDLEPTAESLLLRSSTNGAGSGSQQLAQPSDKDASLLMNIKDTLKRCCPSGSNMPGSSLIASIQEVMIKKSNTPQTTAAAASASEVSVAETAITLKTEPGAAGGGGGGGGGGGQEQYLLMHQSSPHLGVSPPSSFSPGKPERAHTVVKQGHAAAIIKPDPSADGSTTAATLKSATAQQTPGEAAATAAAIAPPEHGEDKVIMHLRKDRPRPPCSDAAMQTEPSARFPPLRKLSPLNRVGTAAGVRNGGSGSTVVVGSRRNERTYRSRRRDGSESSDAESDRRSNRSKSRSGRDHQVQLQQHHRSTKDRSRSRHRSSRRRSSRSRSGSRSRSRSNYSHRVHRDEHHHHNSSSSSSSNNGASGHYSRSRRKSRTSSRSSTTSSRRGRRSMSASSSASSASSRSSSSRSRRSRSPRSSSRSRSRSSGLRSATPPNQRYQSRERLNHRRPMSPERKIVYIGRLENNTRKEDLHQKFQPYGKIVKISLHSKDNGVRYGFVTFEKPQHAYSAIDASSNDPNLRDYDVSFGGRRDFCRMQYADLDGELTNDLDHHMPYMTMDGSLVLPPRVPIAYGGVPMCHKEPIVGSGGVLGGGGDSFEDLLMQFKKGIGAMKAPRKT